MFNFGFVSWKTVVSEKTEKLLCGVGPYSIDQSPLTIPLRFEVELLISFIIGLSALGLSVQGFFITT